MICVWLFATFESCSRAFKQPFLLPCNSHENGDVTAFVFSKPFKSLYSCTQILTGANYDQWEATLSSKMPCMLNYKKCYGSTYSNTSGITELFFSIMSFCIEAVEYRGQHGCKMKNFLTKCLRCDVIFNKKYILIVNFHLKREENYIIKKSG